MRMKQKSWNLFYSSFLILLFVSSCASIDSLEVLNHPAMNSKYELIAKTPSPMTGLKDFEAVSGGGGCSTCAH